RRPIVPPTFGICSPRQAVTKVSETGRSSLPLPLAGEGWGEGVTAMGQSPRGEIPHPRLRRDLSRKRERLKHPSGMRENVLFRPALEVEQGAGRQEVETGLGQRGAALPDQ